MDAQEYINLQDQITRQTPEQQAYYDSAAGYTAQAEAMQPAVDAAQIAVDEAQAALDAAIAAGEDPTPFQEALDAAKADLATLTSEQNGYTSQATEATRLGNGIGAMIDECQALIDAAGPPPTPAQQAAARAAIAAALLLAFQNARANVIKESPVTVALLPPALGQAGARAMVSDAAVSPSTKFRDTVVGGGTTTLPVYSDGTNWRIG